MEKLIGVLEVVAPVFVTVLLGIFARRKKLLTGEQTLGLQQFVMKLALPCVLFSSCLGANFGAEALTTMAMVLPLLLLQALWAFRAGKKGLPYHNLPMLFVAQETGMLGIPLFMALFGAGQAYRMGVMDLAQCFASIAVISILSADVGKNPTTGQVAKKVCTSPLLLAGILGLVLNLSGLSRLMEQAGVLGILTSTTGFLAQPVSALMLFSVGYNFSLEPESRKVVFRVTGIHLAFMAAICLVMQGILLLLPNVAPETRWAALLYCALPCSYLAPSLGRRDEERAMASGVCSLGTLVCLVVFVIMAACTLG